MKVATIYGAPEGFDALLLIRRASEHQGTLLHVARDDARMARMADMLAFFLPSLEVLRFPAWDCLPYDRVSPNPAVIADRIATLTRLIEPASGPRLVLTTINALVQRVPPRSAFAGKTLSIKSGGTIKPEAMVAFLQANGYNRTDTVMEPGEYAQRGGIFDVFPSGETDPLRLDFFGDTVESLRRFNATSQRSTEDVAAFSLRPVSEVPLDGPNIARFRTGWREAFGDGAAQDECIRRSAKAGVSPAWSIGHRCSMRRWTRCSIICTRQRFRSTTRPMRCWPGGWR